MPAASRGYSTNTPALIARKSTARRNSVLTLQGVFTLREMLSSAREQGLFVKGMSSYGT